MSKASFQSHIESLIFGVNFPRGDIFALHFIGTSRMHFVDFNDFQHVCSGEYDQQTVTAILLSFFYFSIFTEVKKLIFVK